MPATAAALAEGKLSIDQAELLAEANQAAIADLFAGEEQLLLNDVLSCRVSEARRRVAYWIEEAYERIGKDRGDRGHDGRCLYAARTFQGNIDLKGTLDPIGGSEFIDELERLEQQMFETDWADGTVISPSQVIPLLGNADIERIVFDGPHASSMSASADDFTGALRRAIEVRDPLQHPSAATSPPPNATSTTSSSTAKAGSPSKTTDAACAPSTIGNATANTTNDHRPKMTMSSRARRNSLERAMSLVL